MDLLLPASLPEEQVHHIDNGPLDRAKATRHVSPPEREDMAEYDMHAYAGWTHPGGSKRRISQDECPLATRYT